MSGLLILLASPSGGGKTSVIRRILKRNPDKFVYSISTTTRKPRPNEINGIDYHFLSEGEFKEKIENNQFLEWEEVHGYYYGTDANFIEKCLNAGKHVLLDLDVNGSLSVAEKYKNRAITVFIAPPSVNVLIERLKKRNAESEEEINERMKRIPMEMEKSLKFDYVIVNENLEETVENVMNIINKANSK